jgi:threonine 3-dehydrogenase
MRLPKTNVWKVRPGIPPDVAAIFDPLGNAMHTVMAQPVAGKTLAIVGAGAIGLMACKIARVAGALMALVVEPQPKKRAMALQFGAEDAYDPAQPGWIEEFAGKTRMASARTWFWRFPVTLNLSEAIIFKGITVRGINRRLMYETWYQCERFLLEHKLDLSPLITHRKPYQRYEEAFGLLQRGEAVKIILDWE